MVERNGSGYVSPTENAGIYRVSRGIKDSYTAPKVRPQVETMKQVPQQPVQNEELRQTRRMYSVLTAMARMMDFSIEDIVLRAKGGTLYRKSGTDIERI